MNKNRIVNAKKNFVPAIGFILLSQIAGIVGSIFTTPAIDSWYRFLEKPVFSPPNWLFAPVWIILYTMMGFAAFLVWKKAKKVKKAKTQLNVFYVHLVLNSLWSIVFFGTKNLGLAFGIIVILWFMIAFLVYKFYEINKRTIFLLFPYLLWVSFALVLNYTVWILNR